MIPATVPMRTSVGRELSFLGLAIVSSLAGIAVLLTTPRGQMVLTNGDSVLLELIRRSLADGGPQDWSMSPVLFLFPELPTYLAVRALLPTTFAVIAIALSTLVLFYVLLRSIAGQLSEDHRRAPLVAFLAFAVIVLCLLTEHTDNRESFELVSLLLIPTYYYGVVLAGLACISLTLLVLRSLPGTTLRARLAVGAIILISAVSTASDPIFEIWVVAPLLGSLVLGAIARWIPWRAPTIVGAATLVGVAAGFLARFPFARFLSPSTSFVHPGEQLHAAFYYPKRIANMIVEGGLARVEVGILFALISVAIMAFLITRRHPQSPERMLLVLLGVVAPIVSYLVPVAAGTYASRYLQPVYLAPLLSLLVLVNLIIEARSALDEKFIDVRVRRVIPAVAALASVAVLVASALSIVPTAIGGDRRPACLEAWINGRAITGAGQYWETRDLLAYGNSSVRLVQVVETLTIFPWLVNIAPAYDAQVSYVVSEKKSWLSEVAAQIGKPAAVITCPDYFIADYAGTPGQKLLTDAVNQSAIGVGRQQGFPTPTAP